MIFAHARIGSTNSYDGGHLWPNSVQLRAMKNDVDLPNLLLDPVAG